MPTLREKLAGLTAARPVTAREVQANRPSLDRAGYTVIEETVPLSARAWLDQLPRLAPEPAALLFPPPPPAIPPLNDWLFLDLETTGLSGGTGTYAFLVGIAQLEPAGLRVRQFFLRELAEEAALLAALTPILSRASLLVTYNGKLFDAPVLETRYRMARLPSELDAKLHLDLLHPARRLWRQRWDSLRLMQLETGLFRHQRTEDVPGELIPQLYFDFLRSGDERPLRPVFRHNADDLVTLAALAARLLLLAGQPEDTADAGELFAVGRLFERARKLDGARALYERALREADGAETDHVARYRLSLLCKRQRDYHRAVSLWRQLVEGSGNLRPQDRLAIFEELAICYEHRLDDPESATDTTRRALAELERLQAEEISRWRPRRARSRLGRRLARLTRKAAAKAAPLAF